MSHKIKTAIATLIVVLMLYLFQDWLRDFIITGLGGYTTKETVTVTKTKIKIGKIDTTAIFNHYVETNGVILNPKPEIVIVKDTIRDTIYRDAREVKLKKFMVDFKDSLIDGRMTIRNRFNGDLFDVKFGYKVLKSLELRRVDTVVVTNTITETLSNERAKLGIGIGLDPQLQNFDLLGSYTFKSGIQLIYEYSNPIQDFNVNIPQLDFQNFQFPRKGTHSIKALYNF